MSTKKNPLGKLSIGQVVMILVAIFTGICVILAAVIGLFVPLISFSLNKLATQNALATPTFIPPTDSVALPSSQTDILSIVINPESFSFYEGVITKDLDPAQTPNIMISKKDVLTSSDISLKTSSYFGDSKMMLFQVYLTGKADDEEVQITNRMPIKVSYESITNVLNFYKTGSPGGNAFFTLFSANISSISQIVWADYSPDLLEQYKYQGNCPECINFSDLPREIQKYLTSTDQNPPDFFLLKKNEKIGIPVLLLFHEPGIYHIQIGSEYIYHQYKNISWSQSEVKIIVPKNYNVWSCDGLDWKIEKNKCKFSYVCKADPDGEESCGSRLNP
jgi:hypothetical protein